MALTDWHLIHINSINGETSFSLAGLNQDISLQGLLIQTVIKRILTIPGSDAVYPQIGSNIGNLFGTMSKDEAKQAQTMFPIFLKSIEDDMLEEQEFLDVPLEPSETLKELRLHSITYDDSFLGWMIKIIVVTEANVEQMIQL